MTMESDNVLGSVHYIAPEQASGGETDEKTDVYSPGITMYEMLTGRLPFEGGYDGFCGNQAYTGICPFSIKQKPRNIP